MSIHVGEVVGEDRAAVRVRDGEHQPLARQAGLLPHLGGDGLGQGARDADEVAGEQHDLAAVGILQGQGLDVQVVLLALGRLVAAAVAGHPHRLVGRDDLHGDAGLPRRRRGCAGGNEETHGKHEQTAAHESTPRGCSETFSLWCV